MKKETQEKKYRLPKEFAEKWIAALRSGKYKQGNGQLCQLVGEDRYEYCCMGVAGDVCGVNIKRNGAGFFFAWDIKNYGDSYESIPKELIDTHPLELAAQCVRLNDHQKCTFPQIADWIEQNVELY